MAEVSRSHDLAPECVYDALVPETYSQGRSLSAYLLDDACAGTKIAGVGRCARSRGDYDLAGRERSYLLHVCFVIAFDDNLVSSLAHVLRKVVDEAVVVVENEDLQLTLSLSLIYCCEEGRRLSLRLDPFLFWDGIGDYSRS